MSNMRAGDITASLRASAAIEIVEGLHSGHLASFHSDREAELPFV
jgi:hypothetical protein